jgi:hypothetical protein
MKIAATALVLACTIASVIGNEGQNLLTIYDAATNQTVETVAHIPRLFDDWRSAPVYSSTLAAVDIHSVRHHAQLGEDVALWKNYFYGMEKGVILESGALNGVLFSTSWFFEETAHWSSIHIEADPTNYDHLIQYRPKSMNINTAICETSKVVHWTADLPENGAQSVNGVFETMAPDVIDSWHWGLKDAPLNSNLLLPIPCMPVSMILDKLAVVRVDIWILDLMGGELLALQGFDFDKVKVSVIVISFYENKVNDEAILAIMEKADFSCKKLDAMNQICVANSFKPSQAPPW